jgi:hypothetical protein
MKKFLLSSVAAAAFAVPGSALADHSMSERAVLGAALGAAVGAYVGAEVAGADGAVIGAAMGGALGASVATQDHAHSRHHGTPAQHRPVVEYHHYHQPVRHHHRGPRHFCPPGLAKQGRC